MPVVAPTQQELAGLAKTVSNGITSYNLSSGKSMPEFMQEAKRTNKSLRYDESYRRRLELIQDFEFHSASSSVDISPDGTFILASGCYPPEIRVFDTRELGLKFARRIDGEILQAKFLSEDFRKIGILRADRTVEFHAQYGRHHEVRIPHFAREFEYDRATCMMYIAAASREIIRLDLEEGMFASPLVVGESFTSVNTLALAPLALPFLLAGGDCGLVECWDTREDSKPSGVLNVLTNTRLGSNNQSLSSIDLSGSTVTKLAWSPDAMEIAVGLSTGIVRTFDIRSSKVLEEKDHRNDFPIVGLEYHGNILASADKRGIKLWRKPHQSEDFFGSTKKQQSTSNTSTNSNSNSNTSANLELMTTIESKRPLNGVKFWPDSGILFTPIEDTRIGSHFIPQLGPAPKWCAFLDSLTEELEEQQGVSGSSSKINSFYEDYVFVSRDQLEQLGAESLIGSALVKAYLHGFWMDQRLYKKLSSSSEPFIMEKYTETKIAENVESSRGMRVPVKKTAKSKVNSNFAEQLRKRVDGEDPKAKKTQRDIANNLLEDTRFSKLWNNPDFEIEQV